MSSERLFQLSVKALIRDDEGRVLLLKRSSQSKNNRGRWDLPGGKIDPGEDFDAALTREVHEETGLEVHLAGTLGTAESRLPDRVVSYLIMGAQKEDGELVLSEEHEQAEWFEPGRLPELEDVCPQFQTFLSTYGWEQDRKPRPSSPSRIDAEWLHEQVAQFERLHPTYQQLADTLAEILERARDRYAPQGMVGARPKTLDSFAEKAIRKAKKYQDPARQLTDLAGGRVVAYTKAEAEALCAWLEREEGLTIDWANSDHTQARLRTGEFGYLAWHYIVQLTGPEILGVEIGPGLGHLKCEVQITTFLQHVWAAIGHDRLYKTTVRIPPEIDRRLAAVAAQLEAADDAFGEAVGELDAYMQSFERHRSRAEIDQEINRWTIIADVHASPKAELSIAHRIGRLEMAAGRPERAVKAMDTLRTSDQPLHRRDLGEAYAATGDGDRARAHLEEAHRLDPTDPLTLCYLGNLDLEPDPAAAFERYRHAHALDPEEPRILVPMIECDLRSREDARSLELMRGSCLTGIRECQKRVRLGVHLPHAHFEHGRLALYHQPDRPYEALSAYARAIATTATLDPIREELRVIERIAKHLQKGPDRSDLVECEALQGFVWVRALLRLALTAREGDAEEAGAAPPSNGESLATDDPPGSNAATRPLLIVAGGCAPEFQRVLMHWKPLVEKALKGFTGTVVGGGTTAGIGGLVGETLGNRPDVRLLGYLPEPTPEGDTEHSAYEIIRVRGCGYTPLGPIQTWVDILAAGIAPREVRVLAVNGGDLTRFECELALALGGVVGTLHGSGRAADRIFVGGFWRDAERFAPLPEDAACIRAFVNSARPVTVAEIEEAAMIVHDSYREPNLRQPGKLPDNLLPWARLPDVLKKSNRDQVAYALQILRQCGFDVAPIDESDPDPPPVPPGFDACVDEMAELEHGRYLAERLSSGWRLGDTNDARARTNPTLVAWKELKEEDREYDRRAIRVLAAVLARVGLKIVNGGGKLEPDSGGTGGAAGILRP